MAMNRAEVLQRISQDMEDDAEKFDGRPFNGKQLQNISEIMALQ